MLQVSQVTAVMEVQYESQWLGGFCFTFVPRTHSTNFTFSKAEACGLSHIFVLALVDTAFVSHAAPLNSSSPAASEATSTLDISEVT